MLVCVSASDGKVHLGGVWRYTMVGGKQALYKLKYGRVLHVMIVYQTQCVRSKALAYVCSV